jgi:hypothetical protein
MFDDSPERFDPRGETVRDPYEQLFTRGAFGQFSAARASETFVSMISEINRTGSDADGILLNERIDFAQQALRDCRSCWLSNGRGFFRWLARAEAADIRSCMSPAVEEFWASRELLENGGFMRYVAPTLEAIRKLLTDGEQASAPAHDLAKPRVP